MSVKRFGYQNYMPKLYTMQDTGYWHRRADVKGLTPLPSGVRLWVRKGSGHCITSLFVVSDSEWLDDRKLCQKNLCYLRFLSRENEETRYLGERWLLK